MPKTVRTKSEVVEAARAACTDEAKAVAFWETHRWGDCPACIHCGSVDVYRMMQRGGVEREARFRWRCRDCKRYFHVRTGTVMEGSNIPLRVWTMAFWMYCSSKKGFSALQLSRMTGLCYKSALFLAHRVRYAMSDDPETPLFGTVEVDETYVGGKPRPATRHEREKATSEGREIPKNKRGRGTKKVPVVALVERGGRVVASPMTTVNGANLREAIRTYVHPRSMIITDSLREYRGIGEHFAGGHRTVNHTVDEYCRWDDDGVMVSSNYAESFFAVVKRSMIGVHHAVSPRHLHRYVDERAWMFSNRALDDGERMALLVRLAEGKRLENRNSAAL